MRLSQKSLRSSIALAVVVSCVWNSFSLAEAPLDPKVVLDEINKLVEQQNKQAAELDKTMETLNGLLQAYGIQNPQKYILFSGVELEKIISSNLYDPKQPEISAKLVAIQTRISAKIPPATKPLVDQIDQLVKGIGTPTEAVLRDPALPPKIGELSRALAQLELATPDATALREAGELQSIIESKPQATLTAATVEKLLKLRDAINEVAKTAKDKIYIISANYGDFRHGSQRLCVAKDFVVQLCQGLSDCTPSVDPSTLCGYDPARFAEPKHKQLVIEYACIAHDQDEWVKQKIEKRRIKTARLKTTTKIYCER